MVRVAIFLFFGVPAVIAWLLARFLFIPRDVFDLGGKRDKQMRWLATGRSAFGFITIVALTYPYRGTSGVTLDAEQHLVHTLQDGTIAVGGCIVLLAAVARKRSRLFTRVLRPVFRFLLTVAAFEYIVPFLTRWPELNRIFATQDLSGQGVGVILMATGMITFVVASSYYAARYLYGTGELHPLLGPGVTIVVVLVIAVVEVRAGLHPGQRDTPLPLLLLISAVGVATTTLLAVGEWRQIRRHGFTIREIPEYAAG